MADGTKLKPCEHPADKVMWNGLKTKGICRVCGETILEQLPRYIYGLDPASKADYFGIVVHKLPFFRSGESSLPKLVTLRNYTSIPYDQMLQFLQKDLFLKYPPFYIVTDYSNEKTFSDILLRDYGEERIELINFGPLNNKLMLKEDGLSILQAGYTFPDPRRQNDPMQKDLLGKLITQITHEQMLKTPSGKTTFDHPQGEHNDIAIAWELSIHGCQRFRLNTVRPVVVTRESSTLPRKGAYPTVDIKKHFPFLKSPGVSIQSTDSYTPS